jgi:hypothetical protein
MLLHVLYGSCSLCCWTVELQWGVCMGHGGVRSHGNVASYRDAGSHVDAGSLGEVGSPGSEIIRKHDMAGHGISDGNGL